MECLKRAGNRSSGPHLCDRVNAACHARAVANVASLADAQPSVHPVRVRSVGRPGSRLCDWLKHRVWTLWLAESRTHRFVRSLQLLHRHARTRAGASRLRTKVQDRIFTLPTVPGSAPVRPQRPQCMGGAAISSRGAAPNARSRVAGPRALHCAPADDAGRVWTGSARRNTPRRKVAFTANCRVGVGPPRDASAPAALLVALPAALPVALLVALPAALPVAELAGLVPSAAQPGRAFNVNVASRARPSALRVTHWSLSCQHLPAQTDGSGASIYLQTGAVGPTRFGQRRLVSSECSGLTHGEGAERPRTRDELESTRLVAVERPHQCMGRLGNVMRPSQCDEKDACFATEASATISQDETAREDCRSDNADLGGHH
jgi:hypothetical protein